MNEERKENRIKVELPKELPKYIVLDLVFYGNSLNYDQGAGNYQELKKITRWDGRQYTMVSRYALRYSILNSMKELYSDTEILTGEKLTQAKGEGGGGGKVIQPAPELLLTGEVLKYPELDLFGYMITTTVPTNIRESPVKITHAVSLTPYMYDAHFNANLWLARRYKEGKTGQDMEPNPFTKEEHETYYLYTVVIDTQKIGQEEAYLIVGKIKETQNGFRYANYKKTKNGWQKTDLEWEWAFDIEKIQGNVPYKILLAKSSKEGDSKKENVKITAEIVEVKKLAESKAKSKKKSKEGSETGSSTEEEKEVYFLVKIKYTLDENEKVNRIQRLLEAILNMNRGVKGEAGMHGTKLVIIGAYNGPYRTYRADVFLEHEYTEAVEERREGNKIIRTLSVTSRPVFRIKGLDAECTPKMDAIAIPSPGNIAVYYHSSIDVRLDSGKCVESGREE